MRLRSARLWVKRVKFPRFIAVFHLIGSEARCGGVVVRLPLTVVYADGI